MLQLLKSDLLYSWRPSGLEVLQRAPSSTRFSRPCSERKERPKKAVRVFPLTSPGTPCLGTEIVVGEHCNIPKHTRPGQAVRAAAVPHGGLTPPSPSRRHPRPRREPSTLPAGKATTWPHVFQVRYCCGCWVGDRPRRGGQGGPMRGAAGVREHAGGWGRGRAGRGGTMAAGHQAAGAALGARHRPCRLAAATCAGVPAARASESFPLLPSARLVPAQSPWSIFIVLYPGQHYVCVCVHACFHIVLHVFGISRLQITSLEHMLAAKPLVVSCLLVLARFR